MTTTTATISYRKTKAGKWVAFGPVEAFKVRVMTPEGWDTADADEVTVTKRSGESKVERISRVGKPFSVDGRQMVYAYLVPSARPSSRSFNSDGARGRGRHCPTGGNCSSFGTGRSCGAHDCDGY
jgi:hypothetical protein